MDTNARILLLESRGDLGDLMEQTISGFGYQVLRYEDADKASGVATTGEFRMIVAGAGLSQDVTSRLVNRLRRHPVSGRLPVVLIKDCGSSTFPRPDGHRAPLLQREPDLLRAAIRWDLLAAGVPAGDLEEASCGRADFYVQC